jgi:zinc protease
MDLLRLAPRLVDHRLENGLRLILLPDPASSLVAVNLWYHVGSKNDPPGRTGLAHLFEHMLFQGSENIAANEHFQFVQRAGGATNASTSFDRTNYYETLPPHYLELGLWLESDRLGFLLPALTEEKFEGQRSVVINERRQRIENQPYGKAFETLHGELYPDHHPYGWPIIGFLEDIKGATLGDVESFFQSFYNPTNAVLTLAGDFEPASAIRLVERYFGDIPSGAPAPPIEAGTPDSPTTRHTIVMEDEVALGRTYFAWQGPPLSDERRFAGEMLATSLTGGKSSPLYQDLVHESQMAQDVTAFLLPMELSSTFLLVATARPGVSLEQVEERLIGHIEAARAQPAADHDLERARNQVITGVLDELQSVENVADLLSRATTFFDDPAAVDNEVKKYFDVDSRSVIDFAARYLSPDNTINLRIVPRENGNSG